MQGRELRGQPVGHTARVAGAAPRRNRVLIPVAEPRIEERARAVHLGRANVRVPVGDRAEPSPRVQVDAREAEGRWEKRSGLLPIRPERLPVLVKLCVEAARPPAREHCFDRREIDTKEIGAGFEVRRERHDRADVQVAVRPAVEAPADAGGARVVDGRVTEGALEADRSDAAARVEEARHPPEGTPALTALPAGSTARTAPTSPTATSTTPTDNLALRGITVRMAILLGTARSRTATIIAITSSC